MPTICGKCQTVHPPGVGCEEAKKVRKENAEEFHRKIEHHKEHCRGCPDPTRHIRELERLANLANPKKEPIRFAQRMARDVKRAQTPGTPEYRELNETFQRMMDDLDNGLPRASSAKVLDDRMDW